MTRDESLDLVAMICSAFPGKDWDAATLDSYAKAIQHCDADQATQAVLRAQRELRFRPSVADLLDYIKTERKMAERDEPLERRLSLPANAKCPPWVAGWCLSRYKYRDFRVWPQQDSHGYTSDPMPEVDQLRYTTEGASLSIDQVFRAIGVE